MVSGKLQLKNKCKIWLMVVSIIIGTDLLKIMLITTADFFNESNYHQILLPMIAKNIFFQIIWKGRHQ